VGPPAATHSVNESSDRYPRSEPDSRRSRSVVRRSELSVVPDKSHFGKIPAGSELRITPVFRELCVSAIRAPVRQTTTRPSDQKRVYGIHLLVRPIHVTAPIAVIALHFLCRFILKSGEPDSTTYRSVHSGQRRRISVAHYFKYSILGVLFENDAAAGTPRPVSRRFGTNDSANAKQETNAWLRSRSAYKKCFG
jgi:hypothetical protein